MIPIYNSDEDPYFECQLERAVISLYGGVPRRKNRMLESTRDFGRLCIFFHIFLATLKLIFGIHYIGTCPTNSYIPYYMWIGGVLELIFMLTIWFRKKHGIWALQIFIGGLLIIWCLISTMSTFFEWEPDYYVTGNRYCNKVIYTFAVVVCLSESVGIVLLVFLICIAISFEVPY